jgi:hypothetical protein
MRVVQERNASNVPTVAYTRGLDLSGSLEGAGGIGGLLARSHGYSGGTWSTHNFYHADGGGNITMLINSAQTSVAVYRYDPYGRTLSQSGTLAAPTSTASAPRKSTPKAASTTTVTGSMIPSCKGGSIGIRSGSLGGLICTDLFLRVTVAY